MKTPDEIKKGLECCVEGKCSECPYFKVCDEHLATGGDVVPAGEPLADWLALVKQLERERDAAVEALSRYKKCIDCKYWPIVVETSSFCNNCESGNNWQWRGAQEAE